MLNGKGLWLRRSYLPAIARDARAHRQSAVAGVGRRVGIRNTVFGQDSRYRQTHCSQGASRKRTAQPNNEKVTLVNPTILLKISK